jgi:uncharacterized protein (DUF2164 family)
MGLLDKVKDQAGQLAEKAQQGVAQGKDKLDELQAKRHAEALFRELGAAYYAQQRHDGPIRAVNDVLAALDAHIAEHGEPPTDNTIDITDRPTR